MGPEALAQVLRPLRELFQAERFPSLLIGLQVSDDAAVYQITEDVAVIQTLDFFTPVVDDPYDYGAIAAANAMSDVYAMGGEVTLALNICGFPPSLPTKIISEILRGGAEKVLEAGAALAGGHTVEDNEPKYGLAVMGLVHPARILTKDGAQPGDVLALTKRLGAGIITTAAKGDAADATHLPPAIESMKCLNRDAARVALRVGVHACTDVTGFGLLGHGFEMAERSGVRLCFDLEGLPFLEGAIRYAEEWLFPGGTCRNEHYYGHHVEFAPEIPQEIRQLLFTPETSGGLLLALPAAKTQVLAATCAEAGQALWLVGTVMEGEGIQVRYHA